ncbi:MAG: AgmX/PglI C-terminal domain-containing protein [Deltaproteobacteria bacterium]|nr:AgmX/PglI C-terminal domain-containing protein [Deltaproteobacteria bacterium]
MRKHLAEFKACNRKQQDVDRSVKGKMVVTFIINPNGRVASVGTKTARFKKTFVAGCIAKVIKQARFPEFGGKPKRVPFPFTVK